MRARFTGSSSPSYSSTVSRFRGLSTGRFLSATPRSVAHTTQTLLLTIYHTCVTLSTEMDNERKTPKAKRDIVLTCRVDGQVVSLEELARAIVAAGGIKDKRGSK